MGRIGMRWALATVVMLGSTTPVVAAEDGGLKEQREALRSEAQAAHQQAKEYREGKRAEIARLRNEMQSLRQQMTGAKDEAARQQLHAQIAEHREAMCKLMEDGAAHRVAQAEQGVTFAQRRVELAKAFQAQLQAREAKMDAKSR